ncbi:MAG: helix-turn-helix domain-containing protein [Candidatus Andeanibacterium colombiense]|uniref:Helix-turn-helix domain-containing protein n=1 Tax=Candidatus Andeanibacterium colombiense TaxID=3121345 RepID=A0AAJ5X6T6_9SPHN|nr:MAG: helix-turn-helix domain-containing protein [Sphingomonadaceae bacterium]
MSGMPAQAGSGLVRIRFFLPSAELAPYVSTYYLTEASQADGVIEDYLHPEWANLRVVADGAIFASIGGADTQRTPGFVATGPTSVATRFGLAPGRYWGIGLLPAGWARFVDAAASVHADRFGDAAADPAFAAFRALPGIIEGADGVAGEAAAIEAFMQTLLARPEIEEPRILALHRALVGGEVETVAALAQGMGISARSLERLANQVFGFPPKLLLRRQRFLRCLAQFMLDPSLKWLNTLDWHYHDQAHFTRDFRRFMTMSPREYAKRDHPVLRAAAIGRSQATGQAVQGLHDPAGAQAKD